MERAPDEPQKHQTNISELKRTFLEGEPDRTGLTEWEKRLSSSPLRSPRLDEAPMIEPLEPDEVRSSRAHVCDFKPDGPDSRLEPVMVLPAASVL